jgi:uncharacterized lipoprotein YmbA
MNCLRTFGLTAIAVVVVACSTPESEFGVYKQSDGAIGVHAPKGAKENEAQDVAIAECQKLGKRTAVIAENRKTVNDRFPITYIYFCR